MLSQISYWAATHPQRTAFIHREETLTYAELAEQSDALAVWIAQQYPNDRTPIVVYGHKEKEMLVSFLACVKAGHAYIPVDESLPPERIAKIITNAQARLILSPVTLPQSLCYEGIRVLDSQGSYDGRLTDIIKEYRGRRPDPAWEVGDENNYYIIYTSGSTGDPKGVQITLSCLKSFVNWGREAWSIGENMVFLNQAPFSFDLSVMDVYLALSSGSTIWSIDRSMALNPRELFYWLKQAPLEVWVSTPSFMEMCLLERSFNREMLPTLKTFLFCGEVLTNESVEKLQARFPEARIFNTYGPTEATVAVTSILVNREVLEKFRPLPVGYCKSDCRIMIADEKGEPVPEGVKGEIIIQGASVSPGYFHNPALTQKSFYLVKDREGTRRAYKTGDVGYVKEGLLFYSGRLDFQVKLHGYRIELEDIEKNLRTLPGVNNAVVVPVHKEGKCQYLAGYLVPAPGWENHQELIKNVRKELARKLPEYMIPRKMLVKEHIPITPNGKADRRALLEELNP